VTPDNYAEEVSASLEAHPGSQYLRTDQTCPSLRQDVGGAAIYMTYFGPFASEQEACAARANGPSDAYVRSLSTALPPTHRIQCA
jgi:serine/threonine-protein kinase